MTEDPTQRIIRPGGRPGYTGDEPTTALPGPLNLAGASEPAGDTSSTDVLSLDELFDTEPAPTTADAAPAPAAAPPAPPTAAQNAETWTAMPVVPVRSEPMTTSYAAPAPQPATSRAPASPAPVSRVRDSHSAPGTGSRLRSDAAAAWDDTVRRTRDWLGRDDNALMLLTALVAVCLILAVAAFSA